MMGADNCLLFYGVRFKLMHEEIALCERGEHPHQLKARELRLEHYWGFFLTSMNEDPQPYLFLGRSLSKLGYEGDLDFEMEDAQLRELMCQTREKLNLAGFGARLMAQWEPDM